MKKVELEILALSHSLTTSNNFAIVLKEKAGVRRLPIIIGGAEAQAIAVAIEKMNTTRPLTHDLIKNLCNMFDIEVKYVVINNLLDGIFFSKLVCQRGNDEVEIDSRTSDAIALALRFECPIYTFEFILDSAGVQMQQDEEGTPREPQEPESGDLMATGKKAKSGGGSMRMEELAKLSVSELNDLLQQSLENEDYERAIQVRDEIGKRKKGS